VDNHLSNSKYCLNRLLADHGKESIYEKVTRAKSYKDLCDALQVEYTEKLSDVPSRGEKSNAAKAADRNFHLHSKANRVAKPTQRSESKQNQLRGVPKDTVSQAYTIETGKLNPGAMTA